MELRQLARTYLVLTSGMVTAKGIGFFSAALLGRSLGAAQLGWFGTATTLVAYLMILTNMGLDTLGTKMVAESPHEARLIARRVRGTRLFLATLLGGTGAGIAWSEGVPGLLAITLALVGVALAFRDDWLLFALGHEKAVSLGAVVRELAYLGLIVAFVVSSKSLLVACICYLVAEFAWAIFTQQAVNRLTALTERGLGDVSPSFLRRSWPIALMGVMSITYTKLDTPLVAMMRGPSDAGIYYAGYGIMFAALSLSAPLSRATVPLMARARMHTKEGGYQGMLQASLLGAVMGCVAAACIIPTASNLLGVVFGRSFAVGGPALSILSVSLTLTFSGAVLLQRLVVDDRQHVLAVIACLAAVTNVLLNLLLIPMFGIRGAAVATVASESLILAGALVAHRHVPGIGSHCGLILCVIAALGASVGVGMLMKQSPWPVRAALSGATVAILCLPLVARLSWRKALPAPIAQT